MSYLLKNKLLLFYSNHKREFLDCLIATSVGVLFSFLCLVASEKRNFNASDFQFPLEAAKYMREGIDPYSAVVPKGDYPFDQYFYYPIMAAIVAVPFSFLPDQNAAATFIGISSGLLAYILCRKERWRLGVFFSAPAFVTLYTAQWSFLLAICLFIPVLQGLILCKPNLGISAFFYNGKKGGIVSILITIIISFIVLPTWIPEWINTLGYTFRFHLQPVYSWLFIFLLLCLLKIKKPEGRLLVMMIVMPQAMFFYDQFILWFVPKNIKALWFINICSWIGYVSWWIQLKGMPDVGQYVPTAYPFILWTIYFPTVLVLFSSEIENAGKFILRRIQIRIG